MAQESEMEIAVRTCGPKTRIFSGGEIQLFATAEQFNELVRQIVEKHAVRKHSPPERLRMLGHELDGAIIDAEQGEGLDDVCLGTMKRVRDALYGFSNDLPDATKQP